MGTIDKRPLKAFVKYVKGKIVAGSLILRRKTPTGYGGTWIEIPAYRCCVPVDPNCVEYLISVGAETVTVTYTDCDGNTDQTLELTGPVEYTMCAARDSIATTGSPDVTYIGLCSNSTSTTSTSTSSTTTTTTTSEPTTTTTTTTEEPATTTTTTTGG